jgi:hypothetical protein
MLPLRGLRYGDPPGVRMAARDLPATPVLAGRVVVGFVPLVLVGKGGAANLQNERPDRGNVQGGLAPASFDDEIAADGHGGCVDVEHRNERGDARDVASETDADVAAEWHGGRFDAEHRCAFIHHGQLEIGMRLAAARPAAD